MVALNQTATCKQHRVRLFDRHLIGLPLNKLTLIGAKSSIRFSVLVLVVKSV